MSFSLVDASGEHEDPDLVDGLSSTVLLFQSKVACYVFHWISFVLFGAARTPPVHLLHSGLKTLTRVGFFFISTDLKLGENQQRKT